VSQQYNKVLPVPAMSFASLWQASKVALPTATLVPVPARPVKRTPFKVIGLIE